MMPGVLVIGIGNEFRRDDGAGIHAARRLRERAVPGVVVLERGGEGTDLLNAWSGADHVVIVDAMSSGASPGTVRRFEIGGDSSGQPGRGRIDLPTTIFRGTSHQIGLGEAVALAATIGALPGRLVIYGVEGETFGEGTDLSIAVAQAVDRVVAEIVQTLGSPPPPVR